MRFTSKTKRTRRPALRMMMVETLEPRLVLSALFVSNAGSDVAAGTAAAPWKTLQHAADTVQAGDVVTVRAGNYAGLDL